MKNYITIYDIKNIEQTIKEAIQLKKNPYQFEKLGNHKTLVMLFFNASLRTRLSTEKAARNLGMDVMVLTINDTWNLEYEDGTVMNLNTAEHIKEAACVISQYADIIAVRAFPSLTDKAKLQQVHSGSASILGFEPRHLYRADGDVVAVFDTPSLHAN